jgi:hypothetical protein
MRAPTVSVGLSSGSSELLSRTPCPAPTAALRRGGWVGVGGGAGGEGAA